MASVRLLCLSVASVRLPFLIVASVRLPVLIVASVRLLCLIVASVRLPCLRVASVRLPCLIVASVRLPRLSVASVYWTLQLAQTYCSWDPNRTHKAVGGWGGYVYMKYVRDVDKASTGPLARRWAGSKKTEGCRDLYTCG